MTITLYQDPDDLVMTCWVCGKSIDPDNGEGWMEEDDGTPSHRGCEQPDNVIPLMGRR